MNGEDASDRSHELAVRGKPCRRVPGRDFIQPSGQLQSQRGGTVDPLARPLLSRPLARRTSATLLDHQRNPPPRTPAKELSLKRYAVHRTLIKYVVLDEATSALDIENEDALYRILTETSITIISISHRPTTLKFHQSVLELTDRVTWSVHNTTDYKFKEAE